MFTETTYRELLSRVSGQYEFIRYSQWRDAPAGRVVLWRHDVDVSPQRALACAVLEAEERVVATYFVSLTSDFYNAFEPAVYAIFRDIQEMNHDIGLHFEPGAIGATADWRGDLQRQRRIMESLLGRPVRAFSVHNPTCIRDGALRRDEYAGMTNAYGKGLVARFRYVSDSNGLWRNGTPLELLEQGCPRLYVLTHPEWWQVEDMHPRDRIVRSAFGRAHAALDRYDALLAEHDRPNASWAGGAWLAAIAGERTARVCDYLWNSQEYGPLIHVLTTILRQMRPAVAEGTTSVNVESMQVAELKPACIQLAAQIASLRNNSPIRADGISAD